MNTKLTSLSTILMLFLVTFSIIAQEKESRNIKDFKKVKVSSGINLYLIQSDHIELTVESAKSELHKIITEVNNGTLSIYNQRNYTWAPHKAPKIYLTFKDLDNITCDDGADVYGQTILTTQNIEIITSAGADVYLEIAAKDIKLTSSGGSDIKIKGTTLNLEACANGGSNIDASGLKAQVVSIKASGGADASVWAEKQITAKALAGGNIHYFGNPGIKNIIESGGGDVRM